MIAIHLNRQAFHTALLVLYAAWSGCQYFPDAGREALARKLCPNLLPEIST
jgi:hypothetical protein